MIKRLLAWFNLDAFFNHTSFDNAVSSFLIVAEEAIKYHNQ